MTIGYFFLLHIEVGLVAFKHHQDTAAAATALANDN